MHRVIRAYLGRAVNPETALLQKISELQHILPARPNMAGQHYDNLLKAERKVRSAFIRLEDAYRMKRRVNTPGAVKLWWTANEELNTARKMKEEAYRVWMECPDPVDHLLKDAV